MKKCLGMVVMEDEEGTIAVHWFNDADKGKDSFDNLMKLEEGQAGRATFIRLDYEGNKVSAEAKNLPVEGEPREDQPDGITLGVGPLWLDKENGDGTGS